MAAATPETKTAAIEQNERLRSRLDNYKKRGEETARRATHIAMSLTGGALAGLLQNQMPYIPGTTLRSDLAGGVLLSGLAMINAGGRYSDHILSAGSGLFAVWAARETSQLAIAA